MIGHGTSQTLSQQFCFELSCLFLLWLPSCQVGAIKRKVLAAFECESVVVFRACRLGVLQVQGPCKQKRPHTSDGIDVLVS